MVHKIFLEWINHFLSFQEVTALLWFYDFAAFLPTLKLVPALTRSSPPLLAFTVSYMLLPILKRSYQLLIFCTQYFPAQLIYTKFLLDKKNVAQTQNNIGSTFLPKSR